MDLRDIIKILNRRKKFIAIVSSVIFSFSFLRILFLPYYETFTVIMIGYPKISPTSIAEERLPLSDYTSYVRNHASLIKCSPVVKKVIEDLQLINPKLKGKIKEDELERTIRKFQKKYISVKIDPMSPFIKITVQYKNADMAKNIANKIVEVYKDWSLDFLNEETEQVAKFTEQEFNKAKSKLEESEDKLEKYRQDNKIAFLTEQIKMLLEELTDFKTEHAQAEIRKEEIIVSLEEISKQLLEQKIQTKSSAAVNRVPIIQEMWIELISLETELNHMLELYTERSPQVIYRQKRIAELKEEISDVIKNIGDAEIANINPIYRELLERSTELKTELASIKSKLDSLSALIKEYENRLKDIPKIELTLSRLKHEVDINQSIYTALFKEKSAINLLRAKENIENVKVVSPATFPNKPKEGLTHVILNTIMGMIVTSIAVIIFDNRQFFLTH